MSVYSKLTPFLAVALMLGAGSAIAGPQSQVEEVGKDTLTCEIREERRHGSVVLIGHVSTGTALSGSYRLHVTNASNGSRINLQQTGEFRAAPREPAELGQITLGSRASDYEASLELDVDGKTVDCSEAPFRFL